MNEVIPHLFQRAQAGLAQLGLDPCCMFDFYHTAFFSGSLFHIEMRQTTLLPLQPSASSYYPSKQPPPVPTCPFLCIPWPLVGPSPFLSLTGLFRGPPFLFSIYLIHGCLANQSQGQLWELHSAAQNYELSFRDIKLSWSRDVNVLSLNKERDQDDSSWFNWCQSELALTNRDITVFWKLW